MATRYRRTGFCRAEGVLTCVMALGAGICVSAWRADAQELKTDAPALAQEQKRDARSEAQQQQTDAQAAATKPAAPGEAQTQKTGARASVVILEVMATDKHTNKPAAGLSKEDFEVLEGNDATHINSFAVGSDGHARPVGLWFVVQCPLERAYTSWVSYGSGFMKGKTASFTPVLNKLEERDTAAVAHWCDNGEFGLDLLPSQDRGAPQRSLDAVLDAPRAHVSTTPGEVALHDVVMKIRDTARQATPNAQPVIIFLYGDHSGMLHDQVQELLDDPVGPLPIVYGINNGAVSIQNLPVTSAWSQMYVVHFLADKTGGRVLSSMRGNYAGDLERILEEVRGRYEIGFVPEAAAGKRYEVKVKLSDAGRKKVKAVNLSYAPELMASAEGPQSEQSEKTASLVLAMRSGAAYNAVAFDASGKNNGGEATAQFRLYIDPQSLTWKAAENEDVKTTVSVAIGGVTAEGMVTDHQVKEFEARQSKAEQGGARKAVILGINYAVAPDAARVRIVVRDGISGHLGSFELPVKQIRGVTQTQPATENTPKPPSQ